ncbi:MAG: heme-binding protein [Rhodospirillales bacterium]|nr:heme-binding protein [Rhodospirillales bacterium]
MTHLLTLAIADRIAATALDEGRRLGLAPLALVVLDAGGHVVLARREDGAGILRFEIAYGKAWGALGMGFGTRELAERAAKSPAFLAAIAAASGGRAIPSPGGVLILGTGGRPIGAVGISGDTGDRDEACAVAGIAATGLSAAPGNVS